MFSFEIVHQGDEPLDTRLVPLADERAVWRNMEALALCMRNRDATFIRVKNSGGELIARAGVKTVLASIEKCPCFDCPIKHEMRRVSNRHRISCDLLQQPECPLKSLEAMGRRGDSQRAARAAIGGGMFKDSA